MRARTRFSFSVVLAVLFPAMLLAQDVTRDWDKAFDFSKLKTFAIKIGTSWNNQLSEKRVVDDVASALTAKGWVRTENEDQADATVVLHGATQVKHTLNTFYDGWGGWGYGGMSSGTTTVTDYKVGTLVVDIFETKSKNLVFRGTASDEISDNPDKNVKKITKATDKLFKDFPPTKGKK
jgi:hypothetical protein